MVTALLDVVLGLAVLGGGILEALRGIAPAAPGTILGPGVVAGVVAGGIGVAVALHRRYPGLALAMAWGACAVQVLTGQDLMLSELALVIVAYGDARYGSVLVLWASLLSVPAACAIGLADVNLYGASLPGLTVRVVARLTQGGIRPTAAMIAAGCVVLLLPWLLGFALRMRDRALASQAVNAAAERARAEAEDQRAQAQQLAEVRAEQTRLARDVHDVVGHSLAVILAQAQSGDYLPDDDPERLKRAMRDIADSARASLHDVRRILAETSGGPGAAGGSTRGGRLADRGPGPAARRRPDGGPGHPGHGNGRRQPAVARPGDRGPPGHAGDAH